jgi:hypothetical protein
LTLADPPEHGDRQNACLGHRGTGVTGDGASRFASSAIRWSRIW